MEQLIEDNSDNGDVADEMTPVFDGPVAGHERGTQFVAPHDDFKEMLSGPGWTLFEPHVVDDQQVGFQVFSQQASAGTGFLVHEFAYLASAKNDKSGRPAAERNFWSLCIRDAGEKSLLLGTFDGAYRYDKAGVPCFASNSAPP